MSSAQEPDGASPPPAFDTIEQAYVELKDRSCRLSGLRIEGLKRTDTELVLRELDAVKNARTLVDLKDALMRAHADLTDLGIFDAVELLLDEGGKVRPCLSFREGGRLPSPAPAARHTAADLALRVLAGPGHLQPGGPLPGEESLPTAHGDLCPGHGRCDARGGCAAPGPPLSRSVTHRPPPVPPSLQPQARWRWGST